MLLPWLLCQLTLVTALPVLPAAPIVQVWSTLKKTNETDDRSEYEYYENQQQIVCETAYCNEIASKILQNRDFNADPCDNFYQYACGSWQDHNPIPKNEVDWSEDQIIMDKTNKRIRDILEDKDNVSDIPPVRLVRKFYRSCMDVDAIEKKGIKPIQEILDHTGGWPIAMPVHEWDTNRIPWQKIDRHYIRVIGNSAFYNLEYEIDLNNTKRHVLTIDQDAEYPSSTKRALTTVVNVLAYARGIKRVVQIFAREKGYTLDIQQLRKDLHNMLNFEVELSNIVKNGKEQHIATENYERMTVKQLQKLYNNSGDASSSTAKIDFLDTIQYAFKLANISVNSSEPIVVYNPDFLHKLARLLSNTSPRVLVNYVQWNMIDKLLLYTTQEMKDVQFNISFSSYNITNYTPRWEVCILNMKMRNAISYMFVKNYISSHVIHEATRMVKKIKEELRHRISQAHWLSKSLRTVFMQKLSTMDIEIGYPKWYRDDNAVTRYYKGLRIGSNYFQNVLNYEQNELIRSLIEFREPVVKDQWEDYPITVNAFYVYTVNTIIIPAAELQDPYFTALLPDAINYATTGFTIGHELSHGFDNESIQFDKEGYRIRWDSRQESNEYKKRAMCFVDQYGNYTLDITDEDGKHVKLDGHLTEEENMADSIGVQLAYKAYKKITKQKAQTKLPGLENVSDDELFFLAFANSWCSSARPEYEADVFNSDEHSPAKYRIIGSLSNMPEFSTTFKCPRDGRDALEDDPKPTKPTYSETIADDANSTCEMDGGGIKYDQRYDSRNFDKGFKQTVQEAVTRVIEVIPQNDIKKSMPALVERTQRYIDAEGMYFE